MSKAKILIVEDEAVVAKDISEQLAGLGYEIVGISATGEEAVVVARERRPEVILMDIRLKGPMDGIATAERIGREVKAPVIYLTAHSDSATLQRAKVTGPFGYILKPFEERELETQIEMALYKHQAEGKLRESEERFRVAQELSLDGFTVLRPVRDEAGRVVDFTWVYENAAVARMNGTDAQAVVGRLLLEEFPGHRGTAFFKAYQQVAETGERCVFEAEYGGETMPKPTWFRIVVVPVGKDIGILAQDITQQKDFQAELERTVQERTAKLEELVGELEHFSYTITHDMRAPLRGMQGFAEMMAEACEGCQKPNPVEFLKRIQTSGLRMDALITDALNYSRAVRQELTLEPVDAGALLRGMLDSYPELQRSKATIEIRGELPLVMGNQAGLTQCFSNLLGNAVKFVKPGEKPQIRIWAEHRGMDGLVDKWIDESDQRNRPPTQPAPHQSTNPTIHQSNAFVRIWVEDKGIGIPELMLPRVFDMFSRGSKNYEGTGIGLALVRKVMDRMGGRVGVESEEGKGSRFWLDLRPGDRRRGRDRETEQEESKRTKERQC